MNRSNDNSLVSKAFVRAIAEIGNVTKNKEGSNFKYADWPQVVEVIRAVTIPNSLAFFQLVGEVVDCKARIESVVLHISGEYISQWGETLLDDNDKFIKNQVQRLRSSITHAKRTQALAFWLIAEEDEIDSRKSHEARITTLSPVLQIASPVDTSAEEFKVLQDLISRATNPLMTEKAILDKGELLSLDELLSNEDARRYWIDMLQRKVNK